MFDEFSACSLMVDREAFQAFRSEAKGEAKFVAVVAFVAVVSFVAFVLNVVKKGDFRATKGDASTSAQGF